MFADCTSTIISYIVIDFSSLITNQFNLYTSPICLTVDILYHIHCHCLRETIDNKPLYVPVKQHENRMCYLAINKAIN